MDISMLIGAMAITTLLVAAGFAYYSKTEVDRRMSDLGARKSALAADRD
ncbi:hypothetical protein ABMC88_06330 [Sulfitobacter sp. HNIBRBA2951]